MHYHVYDHRDHPNVPDHHTHHPLFTCTDRHDGHDGHTAGELASVDNQLDDALSHHRGAVGSQLGAGLKVGDISARLIILAQKSGDNGILSVLTNYFAWKIANNIKVEKLKPRVSSIRRLRSLVSGSG